MNIEFPTFSEQQIQVGREVPGRRKIYANYAEESLVDPSFSNPYVMLTPAVAVDDFEDFEPTTANPGSDAKLAVMEDRYNRGLPLFHPDDNREYSGAIDDPDDLEVDDETAEFEEDEDGSDED